ncbi:hypothetical protein NDU88_008559 [Pleurodeles waltl]|uniref:Uncharacterized protein n=1 Tax=Pleurodeles waltl TaxID=8319 RepID=A0AAV7RSR4_PLEWA|nr:hypothetical protein NDU88_008559 [Pleurodeles waltl]
MAGREAEYLQEAVALLKKAGRMDLLRQEALPALYPARKASHGVAAAVMACSPPRTWGRAGQTSRARTEARYIYSNYREQQGLAQAPSTANPNLPGTYVGVQMNER